MRAAAPSRASGGAPAPRRPWLAPFLAAVLGLAVGDALRPPERQTGARLAVAAIDVYRARVSPVLGRSGVIRCRFQPTCSHYGEGAIRKYGAVKGSLRTLWRILRCGPWTPAGTYDPP